MILAIDTGGSTGWATWDGSNLRSGVWPLMGKGTTHRTRWLELWSRLEDMRTLGVSTLVYERVDRHPRPGGGDNMQAGHVYGGWVAILEMWCEARAVDIDCLPVPTIKAHAVGKANASKEAMLEAAERKWPEQRVQDHNQADALWVLDAWWVTVGGI